MISIPADPYDEWQSLPVSASSSDPRFEVIRATPDHYEEIYDVVDRAFSKRRPRSVYDWLYRDNPMGRARSWIVIDKASSRIVKAGTAFPWPIWRGHEVLRGELSGDAATVPEWQRKGLDKVRRDVYFGHPWHQENVLIAGPNIHSRAVMKKAGLGNSLLGALSGGVVPFRTGATMVRGGIPAGLAKPMGALADGLMRTWQSTTTRRSAGSNTRLVEVQKMTSDFDAVTLRTMAWPDFWCPHSSEFLNWRFLNHPAESYSALALLDKKDQPIAYAILGTQGSEATLVEFAVDQESSHLQSTLLAGVFARAREAECDHLRFFATQRWRHWPLFRRSGFIPYRTQHHVEVICKALEPEVHDLDRWQLMPGDRDIR